MTDDRLSPTPPPFIQRDSAFMLSDAVVAIVGKDRLGDILPVLHRHHFGHVARVIRAERDAPLPQLRRAGIPTQSAPECIATAPLLILANAAARAPQFADLCLRRGAEEAWIVKPNGFWTLVDDRVLSVIPIREHEQRPAQRIPGRHDSPVAEPMSNVSGSDRGLPR